MTLQRRFYNSIPPYIQTDYNNMSSYVAEDILYEPEQAAFINGYIGNVSLTLTGNITSNIISNLSTTVGISVGMVVTGNAVTDSTIVAAIISLTSVLISVAVASPVSGTSITFSKFTPEELAATPPIMENDATQQKYQLSVGVAQKDPITSNFVNGAFYDDLLNHLSLNGAIIDNPNLLFETDFYAWSPPIDYDKLINYGKYFWTGSGTATTDGEYFTKEAAGSQTKLFLYNGYTLLPINVTIVNGLPVSAPMNSVYEDCSTTNRLLWLWNGSWNEISFIAAPDNNISNSYVNGNYIYVTMTGPLYCRHVFWIYYPNTGRWISLPVIVNILEPNNASAGMIWEDVTNPPSRIFRIYDGTQWQQLNYNILPAGPSGIPSSIEYGYDIRTINSVDGWSASNWWRALEDLSSGDLASANPPSQASRPIIEFFGTLSPGNSKTTRNQPPTFEIYGISTADYTIEPLSVTSTIFEYSTQTTGTLDPILGIIPVYASDGTFQYDLSLETQSITENNAPLLGYRFYRDYVTEYMYCIWQKSITKTIQTPDANGLYNIPPNLTQNPDHVVSTIVSKSIILDHFGSVISSQPNFSGAQFGNNSYRFTEKNLTLGATMIDPEESLLRVLAVLQAGNLDIPDAIRTMSREYNKVMFKFLNQLTNLWNNGTISTTMNQLSVTATEATDAILTILFNGRNSDFPFYYSVMGTFLITRIANGIATIINTTPQPIYIPNSSAQIGASPTFVPQLFTDIDGINKIRGHDGSIIPAFNDSRDLVVLELENRFFSAVPSYMTQETTDYSSRNNTSLFFLSDYYGNLVPTNNAGTVTAIVSSYTDIINPTVNERLYSKATQVYVIWNGSIWLISSAQQGDIFFSQQDNNYYIFNGLFVNQIPTFNKSTTFDYSILQYRGIIQRDFDRWVTTYQLDFQTNNQFNLNDKFTWNYSSAGVEGNYRGIYRRCYGTVRPHSHPWEVAGYSIEPDWWRSSFVPTSIAPDGSPRYAKTHSMWTYLRDGIVNPITNLIMASRAMIAPIPVDANGNLVDPITSGMVNITSLVEASLGDDWTYGDGGPIEENFYNSYYYTYALAMANYLMKTILFIDRTWSEYYRAIGIGGTYPVFNAPQIVYNTTLTRPSIDQVPSHLSLDINNNIVVNAGLNSWIAEFVGINGGSPNVDFNEVIQNSQAVLGWKTSGFINKNRTQIQLLNGDEVPSEDINVILHQVATAEYYQSGIIVVLEPDGYRVYGTDTLNPYFRVELGAQPISGGQIELTQTFIYNGSVRTYNLTQFSIPSVNDTSIFSILLNGYRIQDKFVITTNANTFQIDPTLSMKMGDTIVASLITTVSNPSTQLGTFSVGSQQITYFMVGTGVYVNYPYGTLFPTITDVVNMLMGYGRWLAIQGWIFERFTNGFLRDYLGASENFALWAIQTAAQYQHNPALATGQIFEYSVMGRQTQFGSNFGNILGIEDIRNGAYGIVDSNSQPIRSEHVKVISTQGNMTVSTDITDIFGLRLYTSTIQHAVFLPNTTTFNDLIYDPVIGLVQDVLFVSSYRTTNWNGRMEAPGFLVQGSNLFPNWEKMTNDITKLYDRHNPVDDPILLGMARSLFGYNPKSYMTEIFTNDQTQFNFFKGVRKVSGTIQPYLAFARGTQIGNENVEITEDWAWKFSTYGDMRFVTVLFSVNNADFVDTIQVIHFENTCETFNFVGDSFSSCFIVVGAITAETCVVFINNLLQVNRLDYNINIVDTGFEFCFNAIPVAGSAIQIISNCSYVNADLIPFFNVLSSGNYSVPMPDGIRLANMFVMWDGVYQIPGNDFTLQDENILFNTTPSSTVNVYGYGISNCDIGVDVFSILNFATDGHTVSFVLNTNNQTINTVVVLINGIWQTPNVDYTVSGYYITFTSAPAASDDITVYSSIYPNLIKSETFTFTGNGNTTFFPITNLLSYRQVIVNLNGVGQIGAIPSESVPYDYNVVNSGVLFNTAPANGVIIDIFVIYGIVGLTNDYDDDREILIPEFLPPNADSRWLIPPPQNIYVGKAFGFPIIVNAPCNDNIDYSYKYTAALVDYNVISTAPAQTYLHWNPLKGLHETVAYSLVDYQVPYDPARYNSGASVEQYGLSWGETQKGQVWWDTSVLSYENYFDFLPDYMRVSREWGSLLYYNAIITLTNDVATVTTIDPKTQQATAHGLVNGQNVSIKGANQPQYNGLISVTVTGSTTFAFIVDSPADSPATGNIQVFVGLLNCYEWVASPVPPTAWANYITTQTGNNVYSGTVYNSQNPSYVTTEVWDVYGNSAYLYYFWVQNNTRIIPDKGYCVADIQGRLTNPMNYEVPLFGIIEEHRMFVFNGTEVPQDGYAIEVSYKWNNQSQYIEWLLISQNSSFQLYPSLVTNKLVDSLLGFDLLNNKVPNNTLAPIQQLGTLNFPAQTIFSNPSQAQIVFTEIINSLFANVDLESNQSFLQLTLPYEYSASNLNGYWQRTTYFVSGITSSNVYDIVPTIAELNYRTTLGLYVTGDIVKVLSSGYFDAWMPTNPVSAYFQYTGSVWNLVGIDNHTAIINTYIFSNTIIFRNFFSGLISQFSIQQVNETVFGMLLEMVRQNPVCDWFFKTSYINTQVTSALSNSPYVGPDEITAIFDAVLDLKPYRTKLRNQIATYTYQEPVNVNIIEEPLERITLLFDRLACDLNDENAWDTQGWDQSVVPFTNKIEFIADGASSCFLTNETLYPYSMVVLLNNQFQGNFSNYLVTQDGQGNSEICFNKTPAVNSVIQVGFASYAKQLLLELIGDGASNTLVLYNEPSNYITDVFASWNGVYQYPNINFTLTAPATLNFSIPPAFGTTAVVYSTGGLNYNVFTNVYYVGNGTTVSYSTTLPNGLTADSVVVIINGIWQSSGVAYTIDNISNPSFTLVNFTTAPAANTSIFIYAINNPSMTSSKSYNATGDGTTVLFPIPYTYIPDAASVLVNLNGVMQRGPSLENNDYILSNNNVMFLIPPIAGAMIDIFLLAAVVKPPIEYENNFGGLQWDYAYWDYNDLGQQEYDQVALVQCNGTTTSFTTSIISGPPFLFNLEVVLLKNGFPISPSSVPVTVTTTPSTNFITISLSSALSVAYQIAIYMARGFYDGSQPSFGYQDPNGIVWQPLAPSYQHYFARLVSPTYDPSTQMKGCPYPEERVPVTLTDQFTIIVVTTIN